MKLYIFLILIFLISSCKRKERISPVIASITESVYASGIVKAGKQYNVYPEAGGILKKIHTTAGNHVKEGDLLFTIDNISGIISTENAELMLKRSKENLEKREEFRRRVDLAKTQYLQDSLMYVRQQNLWRQNVGSKVELEQRRIAAEGSKTTYRNSITQLNQANADLKTDYETAKNNLRLSEYEAENYVVKSVMEGRVFTIYPEEGEYVNSQTILAVLGSADSFFIEVEVDENDIRNVKTGQQIFVTMDSFEDTVFKATVTKIHPIMNEESGTFTVEGIFTQAPPILFPNLSLEANILINYKKDALLIPREYLIDDRYVLKDKDEKVEVKVGLKNFEKAEIIEGVDRSEFIYKP